MSYSWKFLRARHNHTEGSLSRLDDNDNTRNRKFAWLVIPWLCTAHNLLSFYHRRKWERSTLHFSSTQIHKEIRCVGLTSLQPIRYVTDSLSKWQFYQSVERAVMILNVYESIDNRLNTGLAQKKSPFEVISPWMSMILVYHLMEDMFRYIFIPHLNRPWLKGPCATSLLCDCKYALFPCDR